MTNTSKLVKMGIAVSKIICIGDNYATTVYAAMEYCWIFALKLVSSQLCSKYVRYTILYVKQKPSKLTTNAIYHVKRCLSSQGKVTKYSHTEFAYSRSKK